jgi:hypothetical protein
MKINNKISLYSLYLKTIERQYIYAWIEDSEAVLGLRKCHVPLKYVLNCGRHFSYFVPDYPTSALTVIGFATVYPKKVKKVKLSLCLTN